MGPESEKYGTMQRQRELLEMLKDVDTFFKANGIVYSLCAGTLLGAVRHNGFIPWDDDVDLMVDRDNYRKLKVAIDGCEKFHLIQEFWIDKVRQKGQENNFHSSTIDIFVMDYCPDNSLLRIVKLILIMLLQGMMHINFSYNKAHSLVMNFCLMIAFLLGRIFPYRLKFWLYHKIAQIGCGKPQKTVSGYTGLFRLLDKRYPADLFGKITNHIFEDTEMPIIAKYDEYLTTMYGNYMIPVSEAERVPNHM